MRPQSARRRGSQSSKVGLVLASKKRAAPSRDVDVDMLVSRLSRALKVKDRRPGHLLVLASTSDLTGSADECPRHQEPQRLSLSRRKAVDFFSFEEEL